MQMFELGRRESRVIVISSEINQDVARHVIEKIVEWNLQDQDREDTEKNFQREANPIKMFINSPGGSVADGFAIIGAIESSETPVLTVCLGHAMSMAFAIFASGDKRVAHPLSLFMYHEVSSSAWGKLRDINHKAAYMQTTMDMYDSVILKRTNITKEKLDEVKKSGQEWYLSVDDAMKYGLVDDLVGPAE